jgi:hypothetical protein
MQDSFDFVSENGDHLAISEEYWLGGRRYVVLAEENRVWFHVSKLHKTWKDAFTEAEDRFGKLRPLYSKWGDAVDLTGE